MEKIVGSAHELDPIRQLSCLAQNGNGSTTCGPAVFQYLLFLERRIEMRIVKSMTGSITSSLAGVYRRLRRFERWLVRLNWLRLLQIAKLVIEIIKDTRNLLFWNQSWGIRTHPGHEYRIASS
jgi:hypothetical protein